MISFHFKSFRLFQSVLVIKRSIQDINISDNDKNENFFHKESKFQSCFNFKIFTIDCFYHVFKKPTLFKVATLKLIETILMENARYSKKEFMKP